MILTTKPSLQLSSLLLLLCCFLVPVNPQIYLLDACLSSRPLQLEFGDDRKVRRCSV